MSDQMSAPKDDDTKDCILINVEEKTYKIKRSLLMQRSRYFCELLSGYEAMCLITLDRTTADIFDIIVLWLYTNQFSPSELPLNIFVKVFNSAVQFCMGELELVCEEFARDYFVAQNGPVLYDVIQRVGSKGVIRRTRAVLVRNFQAIVDGPYYPEFSVHHVCLLLADSSICTESEVLVLKAALIWLNHDWPMRHKHAPQVLGCVRFALMPKDDLLCSSLSWDTQRCLENQSIKKMILEAFLYHAAVKTGRIGSLPFLVPTIRSRLPSTPGNKTLPKYKTRGGAFRDSSCPLQTCQPSRAEGHRASTQTEDEDLGDAKKSVRFEDDTARHWHFPAPHAHQVVLDSRKQEDISNNPIGKTTIQNIPVMESAAFGLQPHAQTYSEHSGPLSHNPPSLPFQSMNQNANQNAVSVRVFRNQNPAENGGGQYLTSAQEPYFEPTTSERQSYIAHSAGLDIAGTVQDSNRYCCATEQYSTNIPQYKTDRKRITILPQPKQLNMYEPVIIPNESYEYKVSTAIPPTSSTCQTIPRTKTKTVSPGHAHDTREENLKTQSFRSRPPLTCEERLFTIPYDQFLAAERAFYISQNFSEEHRDHVCSPRQTFENQVDSEIEAPKPSQCTCNFVPQSTSDIYEQSLVNGVKSTGYTCGQHQGPGMPRHVPRGAAAKNTDNTEPVTRIKNPQSTFSENTKNDYETRMFRFCPYCASPLPVGSSQAEPTAGGENSITITRDKNNLQGTRDGLNMNKVPKAKYSEDRLLPGGLQPLDYSSSSDDDHMVRRGGESKSTDRLCKSVPKTKQPKPETNPRRRRCKSEDSKRGGGGPETPSCRIVCRESIFPEVLPTKDYIKQQTPTPHILPCERTATTAKENTQSHPSETSWRGVPQNRRTVQQQPYPQQSKTLGRTVPRGNKTTVLEEQHQTNQWGALDQIIPRTISRGFSNVPCVNYPVCRFPSCTQYSCCCQCPHKSSAGQPKATDLQTHTQRKPLSPSAQSSTYSAICRVQCAATEKCALCSAYGTCVPCRKLQRKRGGRSSDTSASDSPWENDNEPITDNDFSFQHKERAGSDNTSSVAECIDGATIPDQSRTLPIERECKSCKEEKTGSRQKQAFRPNLTPKVIEMEITRCNVEETSSSSSSKSTCCCDTMKTAVGKAQKWLKPGLFPAEEIAPYDQKCKTVPQMSSCKPYEQKTPRDHEVIISPKYNHLPQHVRHDQKIPCNQECRIAQQVNMNNAHIHHAATVPEEVYRKGLTETETNKEKVICSPTTLYFDGSPSILVFGGLSPRQTDLQTASQILQFRPAHNDWQIVGQTPKPFIHSACAVLSSMIYITGGVTVNVENCTEIPQDWAWCLDCQSGSWCQCPPMLHARSHHASVVIGSKVYVIGGSGDCESYLSSVECLETGFNWWLEMAPLGCARTALAAAVFQDQIWVCGGAALEQETGNAAITGCVECYNSQTNRWRSRVPLCQPRMSAALVVTACTMYLVGGATLKGTIPEVEMYDVGREAWVRRSKPEIGREAAACAIMRDLVFFIGGFSLHDQCAMDSVVCYLPGLSGSVDGFPNLPYPLTGMCAASLEPLPSCLS